MNTAGDTLNRLLSSFLYPLNFEPGSIQFNFASDWTGAPSGVPVAALAFMPGPGARAWPGHKRLLRQPRLQAGIEILLFYQFGFRRIPDR